MKLYKTMTQAHFFFLRIFCVLLILSFAKLKASTPPSASSPIFAGGHTMADLEALERQKDYVEFLAHARDIRPSERGPVWQEMLSSMALGLIQNKIKTKDYTEETLKYIEALQNWPQLRQNESFQKMRHQYALEYLRKCVSDCSKIRELLWNNSPQDSHATVEFGAQIAQNILEQGLPPHEAWNFIEKSTQGVYAPIYCLRAPLKKIIMEKISFTKSPTVISKECQKAMNQDFKAWLVSPDKSLQEMAFQILEEQQLLSVEEKEQYLIEYLLQGPVAGETFNQSWNLLLKLGENFEHRQKLIALFAQRDYLPDALFTHPDEKKKTLLIELFSKHFPEYLGHYARTCLDFYKGTKDFPQGNPTMRCKHLKQMAKGSKWLSPHLLNELEKLRI